MMKQTLNNGSRLALAVLMVIVGSTSVFATEVDRKGKEKSAAAEAKETEKNAKSADGSNIDAETAHLRDGAKAVRDAGRKSSREVVAGRSVLTPELKASFDADVHVIKTYLTNSAASAGKDAVVDKLVASIRSSYESLQKETRMEASEVGMRLKGIAELTRLFEHKSKGPGMAYTSQVLTVVESFAHGLAQHPSKLDLQRGHAAADRDEAVLIAAAEKSADKLVHVAEDYKNADISKIVQSIVKVSEQLLLPRNKAMLDTYSSANDVADTKEVLKNVIDVLGRFDRIMNENSTLTVKQGMEKAVFEWTEVVHGKQYGKALNCFTNPQSA